MRKLVVCCILLAGISCLYSCKKQEINHVTLPVSTKATIQSENFTWDDPSADYMPSNPANTVPKPWASGSTVIDANIVNDYHSADGWQLIYNTFSVNKAVVSNAGMPWFFAIYNPYKGIVRFYLWQPATTIYSNYVNHGLAVYGNIPSTMLNFEAGDVVDATAHASTISKVYQISSLNSSTGTWFAFQYELAYDAVVGQYNFPDFGIAWNGQFINVTQLSINGTQTGTLKGTITEPSSFNLGGTLVQGAIEAFGASDVVGLPDAYQSAVSGALGNTINGFFNGILGGSSPTTQDVDLKMNTQISLTGTLVNSGGLMNQQLVLPGQPNSQSVIGLAPFGTNNNIMGVFNLSARPTVKVTTTYATAPGGGNAPTTQNSFSLPANPYSLVVNPYVAGIASVYVAGVDIMIPNSLATSPVFGKLRNGMVAETIGTSTYYRVTSPSNYIWGYDDLTQGTVVLRLTLVVTPTNTSIQPVTIVKSFLANIVN